MAIIVCDWAKNSLYYNFIFFSSIRALCSRLVKINSERIKQADSLSSRINEMLKLSFDPASQQHRSDDMKIKVYQFRFVTFLPTVDFW